MRSAEGAVRVTIHRHVLRSIFDECDRHPRAETGGRLVGTYETDRHGRLSVTVSGVIGPGPDAVRTATSLFQDGTYQERVFRQFEAEDPEIEHLGNWHSHHVNGYPTLSRGDKGTYHRTVNHPRHNTDFFYALLVTHRNRGARGLERYEVRHFVFFRGDPSEYELPPSFAQLVDERSKRPRRELLARQALPPVRSQPCKRRTSPSETAGAEPSGRNARQSSASGAGLRPARMRRTGSPGAVARAGLPDDDEHSRGLPPSTEAARLPSRVRTGSEASMLGAAATPSESRFNQGETGRERHREAARLWKPKGVRMNAMSVLTMYVGQGALAVIRNQGEAIVVDSCLPSAGDRHRARAEKTLAQALRNHRTAGLVLTGFDADHGAPEGVDLILSKYQPGWIMYPKYYKDTDTTSQVFDVIKRHERDRFCTRDPLNRASVRVDTVASRYLTGLTGNFRLELFSPHRADMDSSNNASIVLKVTGVGPNGFSYLVTGDTEIDRWKTIDEIFGSALRSQVLAAPHHGSKNGVHPGALLNISPDTVLISAGVDNQYGHPDSKAVRVYNAVARHVYSTHIRQGVSLCTATTTAGLETWTL